MGVNRRKTRQNTCRSVTHLSNKDIVHPTPDNHNIGLKSYLKTGCKEYTMHDTTINRPRTSARFATLMELYEKNYMLLRLLAPNLRDMGEGVYLSHPKGLLPLELSHIEHNRYTTTFKLTYLFSPGSRKAREPDLTIRLYHDARACEVMSGLIPSIRKDIRRTRDLQEGYHLNRFLHKWVGYCLRQNHSFALDAEQASQQSNRRATTA